MYNVSLQVIEPTLDGTDEEQSEMEVEEVTKELVREEEVTVNLVTQKEPAVMSVIKPKVSFKSSFIAS